MIFAEYNYEIFNIKNDEEYHKYVEQAIEIQLNKNEIYHKFTQLLNRRWISKTSFIPVFLPISFFKTHIILNTGLTPIGSFESSGTSGQDLSKHYYSNLTTYQDSFNKGFELFYGPAKNVCIIALLPSYMERENSSLIYMANHLIKKSENNESGFFLENIKDLPAKLDAITTKGSKVLLLGVTYALLDLIENQKINLSGHIVMETGGMKGRRKEMIRTEVHEKLKKGFNVTSIHSEYGMTELFSQAYSASDGRFRCPPWMRVTITNLHDPFATVPFGTTGRINVTDLANIQSCPFIATDDLGRAYPDGSFEVLGRMDNSELRGCNLMVY